MSSNVQSQSSCLFMSLYFSTAAWLMSCKRSMFMESVQCLEYGQLRLFVQRDLVLMNVLHKEWLSGKGLMYLWHNDSWKSYDLDT